MNVRMGVVCCTVAEIIAMLSEHLKKHQENDTKTALKERNLLNPVPKPTRKAKIKRLPKTSMPGNPLEEDDQTTVADWLDAHKVFYTATMAGCYLAPATFNRMKRMGLKKGVSDILIFDPPPAYSEVGYVGVCLELKRKKGGILSDEQNTWLSKMNNRKWCCKVAHGADEAITFLEFCGYGGKYDKLGEI